MARKPWWCCLVSRHAYDDVTESFCWKTNHLGRKPPGRDRSTSLPRGEFMTLAKKGLKPRTREAGSAGRQDSRWSSSAGDLMRCAMRDCGCGFSGTLVTNKPACLLEGGRAPDR